jgi:hypothetical protein
MRPKWRFAVLKLTLREERTKRGDADEAGTANCKEYSHRRRSHGAPGAALQRSVLLRDFYCL